ncbi:MAG: exodeoxyribonuclease V subunit alpha [Rhizobacter sp.]|nr:exodeoxyribonuclease V subunit alpha [Rhizobacter sp.]
MTREERTPIDAPARTLAEGFAQHIRAWSRERGADEAIQDAAAAAARAVSLALSDGHVCISLADLAASEALPRAPAGVEAWRRALLTAGVVGTADAPGQMPLVLDGDGRLYLHRYFDYERRLAERVWRAARAVPPMPAADRAVLRAQLAMLFAANTSSLGEVSGAVSGNEVDWQKLATALALRGRFTVISGGPGTGKTTTVVNLLACLIAQDAGCRIALAAPTGKAAARMSEAVRERAAHLPPAIRERLPAEASTIHRLLGVTPSGFVHHAGRRLAIDALVVDEASMLDLALATKLLEAVPDGARIVLLGDKDQLAAVESGAVFAELCADPTLSSACRDDLADLCDVARDAIAPPAPAHASSLHDASVWFTRNFRFAADSGIGRLAAAINAGDAEAALAVLAESDSGCEREGESESEPEGAATVSQREVQWIASVGPTPAPAAIEQLELGYAPYFDAVLGDATPPAAIVDAFARFRALCAVREGPHGVEAINARLTRRLRAMLGDRDHDPRSPWFVGRPVIVRRNDPVLKLFNGDIGIALRDAGGELLVHFPQAEGGLRAIAPLRLPEHETAFALTVHKAQGSEFDAVWVLLPAQANRVLSRELLYTAVTRARKRVTLCAGVEVLNRTIAAATRRHSGLLARLAEVATPRIGA